MALTVKDLETMQAQHPDYRLELVDGKIRSMGTLAQYILDRRIPLEMCLSSNVHTGAVASLEAHPFRAYFDRGFRVTLNTDDRLMSDTSMSKELEIATGNFDLTLADLEKITLNSIKSAFIDFDTRLKLIYETIKPAYTAVRSSVQTQQGY